MNREHSYLPLIEEWENYLTISNNADVKDFAFWIQEKEKRKKQEEELRLNEYFDANAQKHEYGYKSSEAAFLIWRLGKFIRFYTKPILLENGLASQDDFAILAEVDYRKSCVKREAIEANIIETSTGIEIIKRLINQSLISEKVNTKDKREKLISLTKKGKEVLYRIYSGFSGIQDLMAEMNIEQRELLIGTLKVLDTFHTKNLEMITKRSKK
nr:winged helix DNA-binding protein [Cytophagales bacterium]